MRVRSNQGVVCGDKIEAFVSPVEKLKSIMRLLPAYKNITHLAALVFISSCNNAACYADETKDSMPCIVVNEKLLPIYGVTAIDWNPDGAHLALSRSLNQQIVIYNIKDDIISHELNRNNIGQPWITHNADGSLYITSTVWIPNGKGPNKIAFSLISANTGKVVVDVAGPDKNPSNETSNVARNFVINPTVEAAFATFDDGFKTSIVGYRTDIWSAVVSKRLEKKDRSKYFVKGLVSSRVRPHIAILDLSGEVTVLGASGLDIKQQFKAFDCCGGAIAFSHDGNLIAVAEGSGIAGDKFSENKVKIFEAASGRLLAGSDPDVIKYSVKSIAFSKDDIYVSALSSGYIYFFDTKTLSLRMKIKRENGSGGTALAFSPDGTTVAVALNDGVHLYRTKCE